MFKYSLDIKDQVAVISFDHQGKPLNYFDSETLSLLEQILALAINTEDKGIILTSLSQNAFTTQNYEVLFKYTKEQLWESSKALQKVLRKLETCGKPVVAALNASTLGIGLEFALAAHYRIAYDSSQLQIGFPDIQLGILPLAGGANRLARKIGITASLPYLLEAQIATAVEAKEVGIIDQLVPDKTDILAAAKAWILNQPTSMQPWDHKNYKIPGGEVLSPQGIQLFSTTIASLRSKTWGNNEGAYAMLRSLYESLQMPPDRAFDVERRYFIYSLTHPNTYNLYHSLVKGKEKLVKLASQYCSKEKGSIKQVGIIGAGSIGASLAYCCAKAGIKVLLQDLNKELSEKGRNYTHELLYRQLIANKISQEKYLEIIQRIEIAEGYKGFENCEIVIETVFEEVSLKRQILKELSSFCSPQTVIISNTAALTYLELQQAVINSQSYLITHFFSPIEQTTLVEIATNDQVSNSTLARAIKFCQAIEKIPLVLPTAIPFFTFHLLLAYMQEGACLLEEGFPAALIENAAHLAGFENGPLATIDKFGLEQLTSILKQTTLNQAVTESFNSVIEKMYSAGRLGKKLGKGFYDYPETELPKLSPELKKLFPATQNSSAAPIVKQRLLLSVVIAALNRWNNQEKDSLWQADIASILGAGFPAFTGGVFNFVSRYGNNYFIESCNNLQQTYGNRFAVPQLFNLISN
ncbi:MAG: 3-hydroxyacyl-CoA dehydrogenase NAD-binding domain-containing protein [Bacteroidia bacterium]|nr:3-hydroxyacyl-CoA dehydrogenase NAD-binding domain-containing protein [Bacteroidia bacterium]MDW8158021.1 3-hydroxyacyl-CoA dehydrogenase NAD-binding domain-containing protein [Bacteroidia bacterium]